MAISYEQQALLKQIVDRVGEIQAAVKAALPGNRGLHEEFRVGGPAPSTPAEAVALARAVEPLAREYRSLLVNRGVDAAKLAHLASMAQALEKLAAAAPPPAEAPAPEAPGKKAKRK
jgi:hypothetical protein